MANPIADIIFIKKKCAHTEEARGMLELLEKENKGTLTATEENPHGHRGAPSRATEVGKLTKLRSFREQSPAAQQ